MLTHTQTDTQKRQKLYTPIAYFVCRGIIKKWRIRDPLGTCSSIGRDGRYWSSFTQCHLHLEA